MPISRQAWLTSTLSHVVTYHTFPLYVPYIPQTYLWMNSVPPTLNLLEYFLRMKCTTVSPDNQVKTQISLDPFSPSSLSWPWEVRPQQAQEDWWQRQEQQIGGRPHAFSWGPRLSAYTGPSWGRRAAVTKLEILPVAWHWSLEVPA